MIRFQRSIAVTGGLMLVVLLAGNPATKQPTRNPQIKAVLAYVQSLWPQQIYNRWAHRMQGGVKETLKACGAQSLAGIVQRLL